MRILAPLVAAALLAILPSIGRGQTPAPHWVTAWAASAQGPYPSGYPSAEPVLSFALPTVDSGAHDQSFRMIVRPDIWGRLLRVRLSNVLGTRPVTFDHVFVGVQLSGAAVLPHSQRLVRFHGEPNLTIPPGEYAWSDPVPVGISQLTGAPVLLAGHKLAVSFHVAGDSGPMTWHAKALTTSYISPPGSGAAAAEAVGELGFPFSTTSWFFLDALDMAAPEGTRTLVAFGDSITDGTASTLNGDDRWPDVLSRRLHAAYGDRIAVVNAGIGGNQVVGPASYTPQTPFAGGPSAKDRLDRDVIGLSGVGTVIVFEGINDLGKQGNATPEAVEAGLNDLVGRLRARLPHVRVIGATLTSALGSSNPAHGSAAEDESRKALNAFIRGNSLFDGTVDFDAATLDPQTGGLKAEYVPDSTTGGPGDKLHPNRAGYQAMAAAVPLPLVVPDAPGVMRKH